MGIEQAITDLVDEQIGAAFSGPQFGDTVADAARDAVESVLEDRNVLTRDDFDPDDMPDFDDFVRSDNFDPSDYDLVTSDELPDFDDFLRSGEVDIESNLVDLMRSYSPYGCSTARAANSIMGSFLNAALGTDAHYESMDEAEGVRQSLITFIASNADAIDKRRAELKAARKADRAAAKAAAKKAEAEAKAEAKRQAKAERKAVKEAERIAAEAANESV